VAYVNDTRTPIKPIKVPYTEEYSDITTTQMPSISQDHPSEVGESQPRRSIEQQNADGVADKRVGLKLLIAEDDPINMKILRKRLEKTGHDVFHAVNGEECAPLYAEKSDEFDVVLMDMQVCFTHHRGRDFHDATLAYTNVTN
jgi:PleD family two-component response regulator